MSKGEEISIIIAICLPLLFFILAVIFRLMDNSASVFLNHDIIIGKSYASKDMIKEYVLESDNEELKRSLKKSLLYRRLYNLFMILMVISLPFLVLALFIFFGTGYM